MAQLWLSRQSDRRVLGLCRQLAQSLHELKEAQIRAYVEEKPTISRGLKRILSGITLRRTDPRRRSPIPAEEISKLAAFQEIAKDMQYDDTRTRFFAESLEKKLKHISVSKQELFDEIQRITRAYPRPAVRVIPPPTLKEDED